MRLGLQGGLQGGHQVGIQGVFQGVRWIQEESSMNQVLSRVVSVGHTAEAEKTRNGLKYTHFIAAVLPNHAFYNPRL